jgi:hypothetical protein
MMNGCEILFQFTFGHINKNLKCSGGIWHGLSKGVEDGRRPPALRAAIFASGHPCTGHKPISGVAAETG